MQPLERIAQLHTLSKVYAKAKAETKKAAPKTEKKKAAPKTEKKSEDKGE